MVCELTEAALKFRFMLLLPAAWAPYFDDMDAIIFLAPISCFDQVYFPAFQSIPDRVLTLPFCCQVLEEDPGVNRLVCPCTL